MEAAAIRIAIFRLYSGAIFPDWMCQRGILMFYT